MEDNEGNKGLKAQGFGYYSAEYLLLHLARYSLPRDARDVASGINPIILPGSLVPPRPFVALLCQFSVLRALPVQFSCACPRCGDGKNLKILQMARY
jgi:hypothetical protein